VSDPNYLLDPSALLGLVLGEDGADEVHNILAGARISAVDLSEVVSKWIINGWHCSTTFEAGSYKTSGVL
jgi:PIN domain nuclease of toxin-antitoxin system